MREPEETGEQKPAEQAGGRPKRVGVRRPAELIAVDRMIKDFKKKLGTDKLKMSVADFIRLVQLRGELGEEAPKEIRVTWVEPIEKESANKT
jgi:hypothetical protein